MGHAPHDSGLSVGSSTKEEDVARIRELEEEVRYLADRANQACMHTLLAHSLHGTLKWRGLEVEDQGVWSY